MEGCFHLDDLLDIVETNDAFDSPLVPLPEKEQGEEEEFVFPFIPSPNRVDGLALDKLGLNSLYLESDRPPIDARKPSLEQESRLVTNARIENVRSRFNSTMNAKKHSPVIASAHNNSMEKENKTPCTVSKLEPLRFAEISAEKLGLDSNSSSIRTPHREDHYSPAPTCSDRKSTPQKTETSSHSCTPERVNMYSDEHLEMLMQKEEDAFTCKVGVQNSPEGGKPSGPIRRPTAEERHRCLWDQA